MPPKKRGRPAAAEALRPDPDPNPEPVASDNNTNQTDVEQSSNPDSDPDRGHGDARPPDFRFFNTTFSTFRVSPLYVAHNTLTPAGLETLSRRLRDTLVGDVVRGVQVGLESDTTLGRLGTLERVEWRECSLATIFPTLADTEGRETRENRASHLLCLELEYEKATFSALMLPSLDDRDGTGAEREGENDQAQIRHLPPWTLNNMNSRRTPNTTGKEGDEAIAGAFARFPLLLTRLPAPLKTVLVDFLSSTFDCRISPLHLGTRTLVRSWERWIEESGVGKGKMLNKDVALTLGFYLDDAKAGRPATDEQHGTKHSDPPAVLGLKTIDVVVPAQEVRRFLRIGKKPIAGPEINRRGRKGVKRGANAADEEKERSRRRKLGGRKDEEGWGWRELPQHQHQPRREDSTDEIATETFHQPFTNALAAHLDHHLALDIFHPGLRVLRVVCDAFALSEGRMKVFAPPSFRSGADGVDDVSATKVAVETFLRDLILRAQGREWSASARWLANMEATW